MPKKSSFIDLSEAYQFINEGKTDEAREFLLEREHHIAAQLLIAKIDTKSNPEKAINFLKEKIALLEKSPKPNQRSFCRLYAQMINCYLAQADLESAEKIFKNISHYEKYYAYHRAQAEILEYKKDYGAALNKLHYIIETFHSFKQNDRVLAKKASLLALVGKTEEAEYLYDRYLKETENPTIRLAYFYFLIQLKKHDKAEKVLQKLLKIFPNYKDALLARETHCPDLCANDEKQSPRVVSEPSPSVTTEGPANSSPPMALNLEIKSEETDEGNKASSPCPSEKPFVAVKKRKKHVPSEGDYSLKDIDRIRKELNATNATVPTSSSEPPKRDKWAIRKQRVMHEFFRKLDSSRKERGTDREDKIRTNRFQSS